MELDKILTYWLDMVQPVNEEAMVSARERWNSLAKPLHGLGQLESSVISIAGITGSYEVRTDKKGLLVLCADNGVVEEGVTQTGQEVTSVMAQNFLSGNTTAGILCRKAGIDLMPIDVGMSRETDVPARKAASGTKDIVVTDAMTRAQAVESILTGISLVKEAKENGYEILSVGEMGIGNTTTSSAVASVLLDLPAEKVTGTGAGLSREGLERKIQVVNKAVSKRHPDKTDPVDVLARVGGFDLAGLTGVFIGAGCCRIPVVLDGFITCVAALAAVRLNPGILPYLIPSHRSTEPGMDAVLEALQMSPGLDLNLCAGEGCGAVLYLTLLDEAVSVYREMSTFSENQLESYKEFPS